MNKRTFFQDAFQLGASFAAILSHNARRQWRCVLLLSAAWALGGCAGLTPWVKPYERQNLATPAMAWSRDGLSDGYMHHVYQARESARGAEGGSGGGCGCN